MRKTLIAILLIACAVSGCASTTSLGPGSGRTTSFNLDPNRSRSCYGGPVYVPC